MSKEEFGAYIGIDWADRKHDVCLRVAGASKNEFSVLKHKPEEIEDWAIGLRKRFAGKKLAVCLEQSRGALIAALLKYDFFVLFPVNPSTLAKYREAFSPSRAKDDPTDAEYLRELIQTQRERLKPWKPEDEQTRKLQYLVEHRRRLVNDRTRVSNRLTALLKGYFPQVLEWFPDIRTPLVCEFLISWPTPGSLKGVRTSTLNSFFCKYRSRNSTKNSARIEAIRNLVPLTKDSAIIDSSALMARGYAEQMKLLLSSIKQLEKEIQKLSQAHEDIAIFTSLPGAGETLVPRLITAFGTQRDRFSNANDAAKYFGIAPVIERSGNSEWIRWRYFCPRFIRQTFHEFANESIKFSFWAENFYRLQREKGKKHHVAIRALAFKWIRIIFQCWLSRTPYDEAKYLKALKKSSSTVLDYAAIKTA